MGVGIGALAQLAQDAGHTVLGSDTAESLMTKALIERDIMVSALNKTDTTLKVLIKRPPIDWYVYTSALPEDHPELHAAKHLGIKCTKRDELLKEIIAERFATDCSEVARMENDHHWHDDLGNATSRRAC